MLLHFMINCSIGSYSAIAPYSGLRILLCYQTLRDQIVFLTDPTLTNQETLISKHLMKLFELNPLTALLTTWSYLMTFEI